MADLKPLKLFSKIERRKTVSSIALNNELAADETKMADEDIVLLTESSFEIFCQAKVNFLWRLWSVWLYGYIMKNSRGMLYFQMDRLFILESNPEAREEGWSVYVEQLKSFDRIEPESDVIEIDGMPSWGPPKATSGPSLESLVRHGPKLSHGPKFKPIGLVKPVVSNPVEDLSTLNFTQKIGNPRYSIDDFFEGPKNQLGFKYYCPVLKDENGTVFVQSYR